ncbi:MAG: ABC transporter permease [Pseudomonadota bacterium]
MGWLRAILTGLGLIALWQATIMISGVPPFILPGPAAVFTVLVERAPLIAHHASITATEIIAGIIIGTMIGVMSALLLVSFQTARRWLLPVLVISQALPVFALAPLLVLWLGYGMGSKIAMAVLIIYFPVTAAFFDGLRRIEPGWLELARVMNARPSATLMQIRIPAALPAFGSGLRVAASVAPIGAVVGEWVGSSGGLGYLMLHANARMQIDLMFAALLVLAAMGLGLYFAIDYGLRRFISWQPESLEQS